MWWWGQGFGGNWGWMLLSGLAMIIFWVVVIALVVLAVRAFTRPAAGSSSSPATPAGDHALAILRERYARGEITKAQYDEMLSVLKS